MTDEQKGAPVQHEVVSHEEWLIARRELLEREKAWTRQGEEISRLQRALPWERVAKDYVFEGASGPETLSELFAGRSQLIVYHFMFMPEWDAGCPHCSRWADNFNSIIVHLNQRDVSMVAISRAPYEKLAAYRQRMGWSFKWLSSMSNDFNKDFGVAFTPEEVAAKKAFYNFKMQDPFVGEREGVSVFFKDGDDIFRTYSAYARGIDLLSTDYNYLDLVPKGRDEGERGPFWVRRHDEYGKAS
jgi:predicted dithiol-disulfide oxidoreductase (DUF899 family)